MRNEALDFDEFYRGSYPKVFAAAFTVSGDRVAALDAVQEAFERAFMRWSRLGREPWAEGWVMTTAMNFCRRTATRTAKEHLVPSVMEGGRRRWWTRKEWILSRRYGVFPGASDRQPSSSTSEIFHLVLSPS